MLPRTRWKRLIILNRRISFLNNFSQYVPPHKCCKSLGQYIEQIVSNSPLTSVVYTVYRTPTDYRYHQKTIPMISPNADKIEYGSQ